MNSITITQAPSTSKNLPLVEEEKKDADEARELRSAMKDSRMQALFQVFDANDDGAADFEEVVVGLYKIVDDIDEASHAAVSVLLPFDDQANRELTYDCFARLMLNVTASAPDHIAFDDVADTLTRNAMGASDVSDSDVMENFSMNKASQVLMDLKEDEKFVSLGPVELAKLDRLFPLFDADHDGHIDAKELSNGLRYDMSASDEHFLLFMASHLFILFVPFLQQIPCIRRHNQDCRRIQARDS